VIDIPKSVGSDDSTLTSASSVVDVAWEELQRAPYVQSRLGVASMRVPDVSFAEAERRSALGRLLLERIAALDLNRLPHDLALTVRLAHFRARIWSREAEWYWTAVDPLGIGLFGLFLSTAYCGGYLLNLLRRQFTLLPLRESSDCDQYLSLVADYARLLDQFSERTHGQAERGIRMPKVQIEQARALLAGLKSGVRTQISERARHLNARWAPDFARELDARIAVQLEPAFDRARDCFSDDYLRRAPEGVGIGQYPGGAELYRELVNLHTTLDLTPEQVHERGLQRMAELEEAMRAIETDAGFGGDSGGAFRTQLDADPGWRADTAEGVTAVFERYIHRVERRLNDYFLIPSKCPYRVAPLPQELEGAMTYGYYDPPKIDRAEGVYLFNAANLTRQSLFRLAALTYHELMPGHHLQFCAQQQNSALHPFRTYSFVNAYIEGWAEYAATWAGEIGLYETPHERYGRLLSDAFLTSRLVVDTGMNVLGWSLERGREYMRTHSRLPESEILTETVRYTCDIPAQALAYKLGDAEIVAMRERMRENLGSRFELKDFHAAILATGAVPLADLHWHVDHETQRLKEARAS
jgi:uncharacterized protein (DUF885 family)